VETNLETLARCHRLALAAMESAAAPPPPVAGPGGGELLLAAFSPRERAKILAVLDRLPDSSGGHGL
jgi:hypothetical protein